MIFEQLNLANKYFIYLCLISFYFVSRKVPLAIQTFLTQGDCRGFRKIGHEINPLLVNT